MYNLDKTMIWVANIQLSEIFISEFFYAIDTRDNVQLSENFVNTGLFSLYSIE